MHAAPPPPELLRPIRLFIVLIALAQGAALYLLDYGQQHGWPLLSSWNGRIFGYILLLAVPSVLMLSVTRLCDARLWQHIGALTVILSAMTAWITWNLTGAPSLNTNGALFRIAWSIGLGVFIVLSWMQGRQRHGTWRVPYPTLFECAWQNAITVALAALFTALCWMVLHLWAELFLLLDIRVFKTLFDNSAFEHIATGVMAGLGVLIGRTQHRPVQIARQVLLAVFKGLLPLWALIAVLFVLSLPVTGVQPLWNTRSAAALLLSVIALMVLFANAVYQDGGNATGDGDDGEGTRHRARPYPRWLCWLVNAGLFSLPVYAALALVALSMRIGQYGWTLERFWGVAVALIAAGYALGYALAALRPGRSWLAPLGWVNTRLSWVVIALVVLINTPVLDGWRITVSSQIPRLRASAPEMNPRDLQLMRFEAGRRGYQALAALQAEPDIIASGADARIGDVLKHQREDYAHNVQIDDPDELRRHIMLAQVSAPLDEAWWQALSSGELAPSDCRLRVRSCIVRRQDLNEDGREEALLCLMYGDRSAECAVHAKDADGGWRTIGTVKFSRQRQQHNPHTRPLREALRNGQIEPRRNRWPDLSLDGGPPESVRVNPNVGEQE